MEFPVLIEAIRSLGPTHEARGQALGVSPHAVRAWLSGRRVPSIAVIARHPAVLTAFCRDASEQLTKTNASGTAET